MSLKSFHTFFIIVAILADGAFWVYLQFFAPEDLQAKSGLVGILSGLLALALIIYLPFHFKKSKKIPT